MSNEVRHNIPMIWYGIWDNYPYPKYNTSTWNSVDALASISKVTHDIVSHVCPDLDNTYIPHAVDNEMFKEYPQQQVDQFVKDIGLQNYHPEKFNVFWCNRNARRKMSGSLLFWWKDFLDKVGKENACLIMHTDPKDGHGQDLIKIIEDLEIDNGEVLFSTRQIDQKGIAMLYNLCDLTINIADAEGFGLSTLESLSSGKPIIVNMTGALQVLNLTLGG